MARPPRGAHEIERTRQEILGAAARVFAQAGYHGATMQAIAREAGFTAASLYAYFSSKDGIWEAILQDAKQALLATYDAPMPPRLSFRERLELLVRRQFEVIADRREPLRVLLQDGPRPLSVRGPPPEIAARMAAFLEESRATLRCPPDECTAVLFGILQAYFVPWLEDERQDAKAHARRTVGYFLDGVSRPARRPHLRSPRT
jgi:AcrR family transcriptional regulator